MLYITIKHIKIYLNTHKIYYFKKENMIFIIIIFIILWRDKIILMEISEEMDFF